MGRMAGGLEHLVRGSKDAALASTMRRLLNARFDAVGQVTEFSLDTRRHRVQARLALRGESVPIDVEVRRYDIGRLDGDDCITVVDAVASREWLTAALQQFVVGRWFHLSSQAGAAARLLM